MEEWGFYRPYRTKISFLDNKKRKTKKEIKVKYIKYFSNLYQHQAQHFLLITPLHQCSRWTFCWFGNLGWKKLSSSSKAKQLINGRVGWQLGSSNVRDWRNKGRTIDLRMEEPKFYIFIYLMKREKTFLRAFRQETCY